MYNSAEYVSHTLDTMIQAFGKYRDQIQVILVDDGSTDNTRDIAKKFCTSYSNFQLVLQEHGGVSAARNLGLNLAKGKYVTFIDSDDEITSLFVDVVKQIKIDNFDIVITNMLENFTKVNLSMNDRISAFKIINNKAGGESPWAKFYKRTFLNSNDLIFNTKLIIGEDALFLYKAITAANSISINKVQYYKQCDPHTIGKFKSEMLTSELSFIKELGALFNTYKDTENYKYIISIENRYKLKEYYRLIENYFVPLYFQKRQTISDINKQLKSIANLWNIKDALKQNPYKKLYWHKRQKLWGMFLKMNNFDLLVKSAIFLKKKNKY